MPFLIFLIFVAVPLVEIAVFIYIGDIIGIAATIGLVVITAFIGTALLRIQGLSVLRRAQDAVQEGRLPVDSVIDGVFLLIAGAFLLTPGMLTDAFGLSMLVPACRQWYRRRLVRWFRARFTFQAASSDGTVPSDSEVVDSYVLPSKTTTVESGPEE